MCNTMKKKEEEKKGNITRLNYWRPHPLTTPTYIRQPVDADHALQCHASVERRELDVH